MLALYQGFLKLENSKIRALQNGLEGLITQYREFSTHLARKRKPAAFSTYKTKFEVIDMHPNNTAPFRYDSNDHSKALLKKFRGNQEVHDIYTKDNRISSLTSTLARYPSPSAPYNVSCIFIMMFVL